ncbi:MAG: hypothetical protein KatS3mg019_0920 [Fimbriimonadales bacterium]|nr:MAG: hypothetical protein KatS3mg019_0920 [Fimbriimonadales bacterium]
MKTPAEACGAWAAVAYRCATVAGCDSRAFTRLIEAFARAPRRNFAVLNRELMQAIARLPEPERAQWLDRLAEHAPDELPERLNAAQESEFWTAYYKAV